MTANGAALHALSFKMWHSLISSGLAQLNHEGLQLRRYYVLPNHLAMYIARQFTRASLQEIGREFGDRHHTTVLHSIGKIEKLRHSVSGLWTVLHATRVLSSDCSDGHISFKGP